MSMHARSLPVTLACSLRAEFLKALATRTTRLALITSLTASTTLSGALCLGINKQWEKLAPSDRAVFDPVEQSLAGVTIGQFALITFGVLVISSEYTTGSIRSSLAAVPRRGVLYTSKVMTLALLATSVGFLTSFSSFLVGQYMLGDHGTSLNDPGVLRAVLGGGVYMSLMGIFAIGVAFMLRTTALSLGILVPMFFLISPMMSTVPKVKTVSQYFPDQAGSKIMEVSSSGSSLYGPVEGVGIMSLWVIAALTCGSIALKKRDA